LIDTETLMHPWVKHIHDLTTIENAQNLASQKLWRSVLRTAFLPIWELQQRANYDNVVTYKNNNLKSNKFQPKLIKNSSFLNVTYLGENQHIYYGYLLEGFQEFYRFIMKNRHQIFDIDSKFIALADKPVRFVFRDTKTYTLLLEQCLQPEYLRNGIDRSIQIDILSRLMLLSDSKPIFWSLLTVEKQALEQMDIPKFTAHSSSDSLPITPNENIENYFLKPSYEITVELINQLSEENLAEQTAIIQGSLYCHDNLEVHSALGFTNSALDWNLFGSLNKQSLVQNAIVLAEEIQKKSICGLDSSFTWIEPQYNFNYRYFYLNRISHNLYDGSCGIALFLAALEYVTGGIGFRSLALGALQPVSQILSEPTDNQNLIDLGIGGAAGLGSILYAFVCVSQFLERPELLKNAKSISCLITSDLIATDKRFDVVSGSAGAILGLLALYRFSKDTEVLQQAIICGYHLINNRKLSASGYRTWATNDEKLLTGFSHGAAGICYALLSLYKVTTYPVFLEAAEEGIAYERSVFIPHLQNWPNLNFSQLEKGFTSASSWCYGASGIGLARVAGLGILNTPEIVQDIESAINTTVKYPLENIDNICCGNLGRVEFLLTAGKKLSRPELVELALKQAIEISDRAKDRGNFRYSFSGFFQGASGIGYQLLRLAYPDQLPSVLLWE
jgi:type 2 lantibiotic biosynthesis protein LanM